MASVKYSFVATVDVARLSSEIQTSSITVALDYIETVGTDVDIWFKAALSSGEETELETLITNHEPTPLVQTDTVALDLPTNSRNEMIVEPSLRVGKAGTKGMSMVTPVLSDKTTWYQKSVSVTDQVLTDSGDHLTYTSGLDPWININHPFLTYTDFQIPKRDGTFGKHSDWEITVKVNDIVVEEDNFTVDYSAGSLTFLSALQETDVVKASFHHLNGVDKPSEWILTPPPGYKYVVEHVEIQCFEDIGPFLDTIRFEIWAGSITGNPPGANLSGYLGFAEAAFGDPRSPGSGYGQFRCTYRNFADLLNASNDGKGWIPAVGELTSKVLILPFQYLQSWVLDSTYGTLFRLRTLHDLELAPSDKLVTATFYMQFSPSSA